MVVFEHLMVERTRKGLHVNAYIPPDVPKWGFPKIRGTLLGVSITRITVFGSILGSAYLGKLPNLQSPIEDPPMFFFLP